METATEYNLLHSAQTLRDLVEREQTEAADGVDLMLLTLLDTFIRDQEYQSGKIDNPYGDDGQRIIFLRQILRTADKILDRMQEHAAALGYVDNELPPAVQGLCRFLFQVTFSVVLTIEALKGNGAGAA